MFMPDEDMEAGAQQPLLTRRSSTRLQERQQFQQSQQQAVVNVARSGQGILARLLVFLFWTIVSALALLWLYVYVGSLYIMVFHLDKPCDTPLGPWLVTWMLLPYAHAIFDPPPPREIGHEDERKRYNVRSGLLHSMWFTVGIFWFHSAKTCHTTNAQLYLWVKFVIHVYLLGVFMFLVFPVMLAFFCLQAFRLYHWLIDQGLISNPKAAHAETIESMEVIAYDPSIFASDDSLHDKRPAGECCCCQEDFGPAEIIVRTPCGHYYHKHCLGEWLKLAKSCPLCRSDLDVSQKDDQADGMSPEPRPAETSLEGDAELARQLQDEEFVAAAGFG